MTEGSEPGMTVEMADEVGSPVKPGMTAKELGMMVEMADQVGHDGGVGDDEDRPSLPA